MGGVYNPGGGGGGGGSTTFADYNTIGTGGDYADVQAMLDDSKYKGILISDVTEDSDIGIDANGLVLLLNDFKLTMGTNQFLWSAAGNVTVEGIGQTSEIDYTYGTASRLLFEPTTTYDQDCVLILKSMTITSNSTASNCYINRNGTKEVYGESLWLNLADQTATGFNITGADHQLRDITLNGGGSSCRYGINMSGSRIDGITLRGSWSSFGQGILCAANEDNVISNIQSEVSVELNLSGSVSNIREIAGSLDIEVLDGFSSFTNVRVSGDLLMSGEDFCLFSNCEFAAMTMANTEIENHFSACRFTGAVSISSDDNTFSGCRFVSTVTLPTGADNNLFSDCYFGGALSITGDQNSFVGCQMQSTTTLNAGADNSIFSSCAMQSTWTISSNENAFGQITCFGFTVNGDRNKFSGINAQSSTITVSTGADNNKFYGVETSNNITSDGDFCDFYGVKCGTLTLDTNSNDCLVYCDDFAYVDNGTNNTQINSAGGGGGTAQQQQVYPLEDIAHFTTSVTGSGAVTQASSLYGISLDTGATDGSKVELIGPMVASQTLQQDYWSQNFQFKFISQLTNSTADAHVSSILYGTATDPDSSGGITAEHCGFILDTTVLDASNSQGTTQTTTDISSGVTMTNLNAYYAVADSGTDIKYYVNGTLKATHTTNLPTGTTNLGLQLYLKNDAGITTSRNQRTGVITLAWDAI